MKGEVTADRPLGSSIGFRHRGRIALEFHRQVGGAKAREGDRVCRIGGLEGDSEIGGEGHGCDVPTPEAGYGSPVIHDDHPFAVPEDERDPVRRFRGRLAAPVTVVTAGSGDLRTGLTVSSLLVADGTPGTITFLCGRNADLGDVIAASGGFVVHALSVGDEWLSDRFAGVRPSPGGLFSGLDAVQSPRGPVIATLGTRAMCVLTTLSEAGWYQLIEGVVESVVLGDTPAPLLRFRGRYFGLEGGPV